MISDKIQLRFSWQLVKQTFFVIDDLDIDNHKY